MSIAKKVGSIATKVIAKTAKKLGKHAPTIMFAVGCSGIAIATVEACKASTTIEEEMEKPLEQLKMVKAGKEMLSAEPAKDENGNIIPPLYTINDYRKDIISAYWDIAWTAIKAYGIPAGIDILSFALLIGSHGKLKLKNKELSAGLASVSAMYANYRNNVIADLGAEADTKYRLGTKTETIVEPVLDKNGNPKVDKNGNPKFTETKIETLPSNYCDDINTALWDENTAWSTFDTSSDPVVRQEMNLNFILQIQSWATEVMKRRYTKSGTPGYIFINEVREKLGLKPVDVGGMFGWIYDPFNPEYDNHVDFGLLDPTTGNWERKQAFLRGDEEAIVLTFNHDGYILDKVMPQTRIGKEIMRRIANEA